jgi:hypothetical protein
MNKKRFILALIILTTFVLFSRPPGPPGPPGPPPPPFPPPRPPEPDPIEYRVDISTNPDEAYFKIEGDSRTYGPTPTRKVFIKGETYNFTFFKDGYESKRYSYTCDGSSIYVTLNSERSFINIKLPRGAQLFVNGREERLNWDRRRDWDTFQIYGKRGTNVIRIIYYDFDIERRIEFDNRRTYNLNMDLN